MNVNPFSYLIEKLKSKVSKSGDTMSGNLSVRVSGNAFLKVTNTDKSTDATINSATNGQHGLYSNGYNDGTFHDSGKWLINRETNGTTKLNGNITVPSSSGTLALTSDLGVTYSKSVSNLSINSAVGNLFEGVVAVSTGTSGVGKRVVATFVPTSSFAFAVVRSVTASEVNISLEKGNSGTVSGTVYVTIYP